MVVIPFHPYGEVISFFNEFEGLNDADSIVVAVACHFPNILKLSMFCHLVYIHHLVLIVGMALPRASLVAEFFEFDVRPLA